MRKKEKILLVGIGELGGIVLEFLSRIENIGDIVTADYNEEWGIKKTNSAILGASYMGKYPSITFKRINLLDVNQTAEILQRINPSVIYNSTTLQSWWVINELPPDVNAKIYTDRCGIGPWSAMHLALTHKLMKAIKLAEIEPLVVSSSFPDVTNPSLAKIGLEPTVGIGNMDLLIPYIQKATSEELSIPMCNVEVQFIGHHYHCYNWARNGKGYEVPHYLKVYVGNQDVTPQLGDGNMKRFVSQLPKHAQRPGGRHGQYLVAASSVKNIMAIFNDTGELTHAPGPQGLEGGYPVRLSRRGAEVVLPYNITLEQARELNVAAQQFDGIQEIRENGDVVVTSEAYENFKRLFGVDCRTITIEDSYEQAKELRTKLEEFSRKVGVIIPS